MHSLNLCGFNFFINFEELKFEKKIGEGGRINLNKALLKCIQVSGMENGLP